MTDHFDHTSLVWRTTLKPRVFLRGATACTFIVFLTFLFIGVGLDDEAPSISAMVAKSREMTLTFTLMVYLHSYAAMAYLILLSRYVEADSTQYRTIALLVRVYLGALVLLCYVPIEVSATAHHAVAFVAFSCAAASGIFTKHSFFSGIRDRRVVCVEIAVVVTIAVTACTFWATGNVWAEYVLVGVVIMDKELKIVALERTGLVVLSDSYVQYSFHAQPRPIEDVQQVQSMMSGDESAF